MSDLNNRYYLLLILSIVFLSCSQQSKETEISQHEESGKPNILFLIADDWSYAHAGANGDKVVQTPTFDKLADNGALFKQAYTAAPSCSPSRAAILTSRYPHQLEAAGNLWSVIPSKFPNWVSLLSEAGYFVGKSRKGWGPGDFKSGGYAENPAGKNFSSFEEFIDQRPDDTPFSYWFGSYDPHRSYVPNAGLQTGMKLKDVIVPGFLPDVECVRNDILDYYFEVERFDRECGRILRLLEEKGELDNTIVVMTSDNGMPFPRAKANLYDYGTRMPLVIRWPSKIPKNIEVDEFVNFVDFGPTFLEAAGIDIPKEMSGKSLLSLFTNSSQVDRDQVYLERERHANVRKGDLSYPMRAVRNHEFLYIRNFFPDRWPAGDPTAHQAVGQWGDVDNSISKFLIMNMENDPTSPDYFELSFAKRAKEELYDVIGDPFQLVNLAENQEYNVQISEMRSLLNNWMVESEDIRAEDPESVFWDTVRYVPTYQYHDYDLAEKIEQYRIKPIYGPNSREGIPCLDVE